MLETFASTQLFIAALASGATYALVALGLNLVYGTMRLLNVAHGDLAMLGAYAAYWAFTLAGLSPLVSIAGTALVAAGIGWIAYDGLFKGVIRNTAGVALLESRSLLVFFGLSIIVQNLMALGFTATARGYDYLGDIIRFGGASLSAGRLAALIVSLLVLIGLLVFLRLHPFGLAMRALIEHRVAAAVVGVDVARVERTSFMLGFATAAIAGSLISMTEQISPFMGFPFTIAAFVVVILGGLGNVFGGMVAALVFGVIETYGVALTSPAYRSILLYGVFVAALLLRPEGLFGRRAAVR